MTLDHAPACTRPAPITSDSSTGGRSLRIIRCPECGAQTTTREVNA